MDKRMPERVREAFLAEAWAITPEGLRKCAAILDGDVDELRAALEAEAERFRDLGIASLAARDGEPMENTHTVERHGPNGSIAVIPVEGPIFPRANLFTRISGATSCDIVAKDLTAALDDLSTRAIVLRVNSPGGTVEGSHELARLIRNSTGTKPIVAYVPHLAGSAAYHIAAATDRIYAFKASSLGSIGTVLKANQEKGKEGEIEFVSAQSPYKRIDLGSDDGKSRVQTWVNDIADEFVSDVAEFRGVDRAKVLADFGQGDLMIASKAKAAGMVDELTTFEELLALLAEQTASPTFIGRSRFVAGTGLNDNAKERTMNTQKPDPAGNDLQAQHEAALERIRELEAKSKTDADLLAAEARTRITAEVRAFTVPLLAKDDVRFNVQTVNAYANLLTVAKSAAAGLTVATIKALAEDGTTEVAKEIPIDVKSVGAFFAAEIARLTSVSAKFAPPTDSLKEQPAPTSKALSRADFEAADRGDETASGKIDAAVREVIAGDMTKYAAAFADLRRKTFAIAA